MDEREKRDVREWSQTSDTRRRRPENNARKPVNRSGQSRQRMSEAGPGRNRRPADLLFGKDTVQRMRRPI